MIAGHKLRFAVIACLAACSTLSFSQSITNLKGGGATFPYPIYAKWFANYSRQFPTVQITYDPVGSEAGVRALLGGGLDFGASDNPEILRELAQNEDSHYLLLPSVIGAVVPIVNLPGITGEIAFTPETLAGIYLGTVRKWNDPRIRQANPRLHLPDSEIVVVHRSDGSGTTYVWTDYLSKTSSEWKARIGSGMAPVWLAGRPATGNDGVAKLVQETRGSIGYVEFLYALQHHLRFGSVENRTGRFVTADLESITAAVDSVAHSTDLKASIVNAPGKDAYPIASFTWFVVPTHIVDRNKREALVHFMKWMLGPGQKQAAALGYVALPIELANTEEAAIAAIH